MEGEKTVDGEKELTSTSSSVMDKVLSTNDEKSDSNDSLPTSSTDASTSIKSTLLVSDDPISSTSSEMTDSSKTKSSRSVPTDAVDNACVNFDTEAELLAISNVDRPSGKIEENVDDLVNDLETLLGESNSFTCSTRTAVDAEKTEVTSENHEVVPAPNKDKPENEVSSNTDTAPDKIEIVAAEEIGEVLPNTAENSKVVESPDGESPEDESVVVIQSEVKQEGQKDEATDLLEPIEDLATGVVAEKCRNESDVTNESPSQNYTKSADSGSSKLHEGIEASASKSMSVDFKQETDPAVESDEPERIEKTEANESIDNIPSETVEEPTQAADDQDSTTALAREEEGTTDHTTSQVNNLQEEENEEKQESSSENVQSGEIEIDQSCDDAMREETTDNIQDADVSEDVENSSNVDEHIDETAEEKNIVQVEEVISDDQDEPVQVKAKEQDDEIEDNKVNIEKSFDNAQLLEENINQSEENTEMQVNTDNLNESADVSEDSKTEEQDESSQVNILQENNGEEQEPSSENTENKIETVESFVPDVSEEAETEQEQSVESSEEHQENMGNNELQGGEELESTVSIQEVQEESKPKEFIGLSNPVNEDAEITILDQKIYEDNMDPQETTMDCPEPEPTLKESCDEHVDSNSAQLEQCASEAPTDDVITQDTEDEKQPEHTDRPMELKESSEAPTETEPSQHQNEQEVMPNQLPQEIEITDFPDVAAVAEEAEVIEANPVVEEPEDDNGDVPIVTDPEQAQPEAIEITETDDIEESVSKEGNEELEHITPPPDGIEGVEEQPERSPLVTIGEKSDEENGEVEEPSAEELNHDENVAVAEKEPQCDYVESDVSIENSECIDSPTVEVTPPEPELEEQHTDEAADIAEANANDLETSSIEQHAECEKDITEEPATDIDHSESGELAKDEDMDSSGDRSEVLKTEAEGEICSIKESSERNDITIESADSDNVADVTEPTTEKVTIIADIDKDETMESKSPKTEFCEETKLAVEEGAPSPTEEPSADDANETAAESQGPDDKYPLSEKNEEIEDVHQDTSEFEDIDEAKTSAQIFESQTSELNLDLEPSESVAEDDLRNSKDVVHEVFEVDKGSKGDAKDLDAFSQANASPKSESTQEKKPAPEINIRRKTVEQDLEKVVCLSEESSDSDINEPVALLPKQQTDILPPCDGEVNLINIAREMDDLANPELPCEENEAGMDDIVSVESHAIPPVTPADSASNLETILAVASLQNDSIPDLRGERRLSEKEIREMEALRMAVASITDSSQDTYDSYLVNNSVLMEDIHLPIDDNGVQDQEISSAMEILSSDPEEIDGENAVIDSSCADIEDHIVVQKGDSVDKAEEDVEEIGQVEADSDATNIVYETRDESPASADDGVFKIESIPSLEMSENVENVGSHERDKINERESAKDVSLEAPEMNETDIPDDANFEQDVAENDISILNNEEVALPDNIDEEVVLPDKETVKSDVALTSGDTEENEVTLPDQTSQHDFEMDNKVAVPTSDGREENNVSLPDLTRQPDLVMNDENVVASTEDVKEDEVCLPDMEIGKEDVVPTSDDRKGDVDSLPDSMPNESLNTAKEDVTTASGDKACLSDQTPNQNFEIADTVQDVGEEVDEKIEEAEDEKAGLVCIPDPKPNQNLDIAREDEVSTIGDGKIDQVSSDSVPTPSQNLEIAKEDVVPTTEDGKIDQVSLSNSKSIPSLDLEIASEDIAPTSEDRVEDHVYLSDSTPNEALDSVAPTTEDVIEDASLADSTPNENLNVADEDLVPPSEDKVSLPDSTANHPMDDERITSKDRKEDEISLPESTPSQNLETVEEDTVPLFANRKDGEISLPDSTPNDNLEIAKQDTLPTSEHGTVGEGSLPDLTPNQNLKTAEEDVIPISEDCKMEEVSLPDSTPNQKLEISKEDPVEICEDGIENEVSLPDLTSNQNSSSNEDRKEVTVSKPDSTPNQQLMPSREEVVPLSEVRKEDEVMSLDSTPKEDIVPTEGLNEDKVSLPDTPCQIEDISEKEELTVCEDVKEDNLCVAAKTAVVDKKVSSNKGIGKDNEAADSKKAALVDVVNDSRSSTPKATVNVKEVILPEQNNVSVSEGAEEPEAPVVEERPLRSRTRRGNKVSEPLSINVDELEKKEKVYSPKVTIKPVKVPDEEVSTTSDVDVNKGSLKMTITKQSDKMHSILKVFNPEDEAESLQNQEEPIPKLIIKPKLQIEQQHSPKMTTRSSKAYSPTSTRCSSPRVTIKPITKPADTKTEAHSPLKITLKPVIKTEEAAKKHSPKASKEQEQKSANPKITIKPIPKPTDVEKEESSSSTPKVTIKPLKRPLEENDAEADQERSSPKITIKPVVKPSEEEPDQSPTPKLKIKPIKKQEEEDMLLEKDDQTSPKVSIKPVVKPVEPVEEQEEVKERIVLKINKGTFPSPAKDPKKREHPDDDKSEKVAIKLKFSTTGGHTHIIQDGEESSNKRQRKDSGYSGGAAKKDIEEHSNKRTLEEKLPEKNKRLRSATTPDAVTENSNDVGKSVEPKVDSPIVINDDFSRSQQSGDSAVPKDCFQAPTPDISKIVDIASRTTHIEASPVLTVGVATPTFVVSGPRKRGRPRKTPLVVRQEFAGPPTSEGTPVAGAATTPGSDVGTPEATPSPGGRPKRSCRGQNVMATLGIKPRKPRGRGRGRGSRVNMGDREPPATPTVVEPVQTVPMKPEKEPKLSKAKLKLIQKAAEEEAQKQKAGDSDKVGPEKDGAKHKEEGGNKKKESPVKQENVQKQKGAPKASEKALKGEEETKTKKEAGEKSDDSARKTLSSEKQAENGAEGRTSPKKKKEDKTPPKKPEATFRRQKNQVPKVGGKTEKSPADTPKAALNKSPKKLTVSPSTSSSAADPSNAPKKELVDTESAAPSTSTVTAADEVVSISTDDNSCAKVETNTELKSENNDTNTNISESQVDPKNSSPKKAADQSEEQTIEEKRPKVETLDTNPENTQEESAISEDNVEEDKEKEGTADESKEEDEDDEKKINLAEDEADSGDDSESERRKEWIRQRKQEAIKKCRAKRMEKLARAAELKRKRQEQAAQQREARKAAEEAEKTSERGRATKRYGRYGVPKPQISLIDEPVQETAGTIKSHMGLFDPETERIGITQPILIDEDSNLDKESLKHLEGQLTPVKSSPQKAALEPMVVDPADDTPTKIRRSIGAEDVVMLDEDTRMSADFRGSSRAQTPAKQSIAPADMIVEDSQGSMGTEGGKSRSSKAPKMEVFQDLETIFTADQLAEYSWNGQGPFMLQEQVTQYLGIKSFKRKYPNIPRRPVDMQERDYLKENGLATEAQCDLGLTAVIAQDILDIMYSDFQDKYEDYCRSQREKQARELANKQKALSEFVLKPGFDKLDILEQAVQSAAAWNQQLNKSRREQRKAHMDLQNLTVHYPKSKMKVVPTPKIGHYPVALVPGQFTDHYKEFTPTELNNLPLNTMCYDEIKIPGMESDSEDSNSGSGSDSESSSGSSSRDSSCDDEDCKDCAKKIKTEANGTRETDSDDVVIIENDASSSDSVVLVSVTAAPIPA